MIQFLKIKNKVRTRAKLNYRGQWNDHGNTLLKDRSWNGSTKSDLEAVPMPKLELYRILHVHQTIILHIGNSARTWWNSVAAQEVADEEPERING